MQAFIKDNVSSYQPTPEDLDFPGKLERLAAAEAADAASAAAAAAAADGEIQGGEGEGGEGGGSQQQQQQQPSADPYSAWYLPLRSTLLVLSKLYRAVDPRIFAGGARSSW